MIYGEIPLNINDLSFMRNDTGLQISQLNNNQNEKAIRDCVLAKIYWSVNETEAWISDS